MNTLRRGAAPLLYSFLVCACALLFAGCEVFADYEDTCDNTEPRELSASVDGASSIEVIALAGSLEVVGTTTETVEAVGEACASRQEDLSDIQLTSRRSGDRVIVEVVIPEKEGNWNQQRRLDLRVEVPSNLSVRIKDGSGSIMASDLADLEVDDGSGSLDVRNIAGDLRIGDGSGSVNVDGVGGNAWIDDGSGSLIIARVDGNLEIEDGSGEIEVRTVGRDVLITEDGSGPIDVADVGGNFEVRRDGSGSIAARDVSGDFIVDRDGSGGIRHDGVGGRVSIPEDD